MTNRRKPAQRPTTAAWKPTRPRAELLRAIGAASGVVVITALLIFLIKPADTSTPDTSVPATTQTLPADASTVPTAPAGSTTTLTQP